jgi:manganese/zinc/iron transport system substrate-binding protein
MRTPTPVLRSTLGFLLTGLVSLVMPACGQQESSSTPESARLAIAATTGMVADSVRTVAGERADVVGLINSGVDPHLYKATRSDIKKIMDADAVFYNGLLLEGKLTDTLIRAASSGKPVHAVTELVDESSLLEPEGFNGHFDPHLWMDPRAWAGTVGVVRDRLTELDPGGGEIFSANAAAYEGEIAALDAYAETVLRTVPASKRVLVTAHDAFNYFGRRYGFEVVGIQGISTESEAGVRDIERLVDLLVDREIGAVFIESTVSDRNIGALVAGAGARGHTVSIGGELFSDAMGRSGTYEGTYIGMLDHNITTIVRALGGDAPELGMRGRLTPGTRSGG